MAALRWSPLRLWFYVIQRLIHRQFPQHHQLCNANRGSALGGGERGGEVVEHFAGGAEGFAGVGQQGFGVVGGVGEVHGVGFVDRGHDAGAGAEVVVEGAFGGFVEASDRNGDRSL